MDKLRISYIPREDATPKSELSALAAVYKFVLERYDEGKKGSTSESGGEDAQGYSSQERYPMAEHE